MFRIRFHGRGGQGIKTASRILGSAFFLAGYEVQDAPRYGAERRGAPIFAYVRADREPINERGIIRQADLVVVADDSLVPVPAAGVLAGCDANTVLLINSHESAEVWRGRLNLAGPVLILPARDEVADRAELPYVGAACAGAAARLCGMIALPNLQLAVREELGHLGGKVVADNLERAAAAYQALAEATDAPIHLGITEAGGLVSGTIKSAIGLGNLLWMGIGDTIRVSLSADPVEEVNLHMHIRFLRRFIEPRSVSGSPMVRAPTIPPHMPIQCVDPSSPIMNAAR